jgi:hypothetical protein
MELLIDVALTRLASQGRLLCLVPEFAPGLRERLEQRGFTAQESFEVLARRIARPVRTAVRVKANAQAVVASAQI